MDYSQITDWLYIGTTPQPKDYSFLHSLGVRLVINMRVEKRPVPDPQDTGLRFLWLPTFDSPFIPIPIRALQKGVQEALDTIEEGDRVYVHCAAGAHRGAAMGSAILIAKGYSPQEAMERVKANRPNADPDIWYIRRRILRFAHSWDHHGEN